MANGFLFPSILANYVYPIIEAAIWSSSRDRIVILVYMWNTFQISPPRAFHSPLCGAPETMSYVIARFIVIRR